LLLRSACLRPAAVSFASFFLGVSLAACARPAARDAALSPARAADGSAAPLDADEQRAHDLADAFRARILAATEFSDLGETGCDVGILRTFTDTTKAGRLKMEREVDRLERLIIARGIETPLDTPDGHALLATVIAWEAGGPRPRWDVTPGGPVRLAIAPGLAGRFRNPATGKCEAYVADDTTTFIIPPVTNFAPPKLDSAKAVVYMGEQGLNQAREAFFANLGAKDSASVFNYTRLRAVVIWHDYAVVAVNRPAERRGIQELPNGSGGASYIFHRAEGQWRLLTIARTWA
jgi:hypothetical protein